VRYALLFPGQGSQKVGMGADFRRLSARARDMYAAASRTLGYDLADQCEHGPAERLSETLYTQPALYVTSCAALECLRERTDAQPFAVAGHSIGEYAALYAASAFDFGTGLELVRRRAELMHTAAQERPGAMAAVLGLDADKVDACCREASSAGVVGVANFNCPGQVVISGEEDAVAAASELARQAGAKRVVRLSVSGGFHSPLMVSAGDALYPALRDAAMRDPNPPVVVNVAAEFCRAGQDLAPYLTMQVSGPVRWEDSMRLLTAHGMELAVELGSGSVLGGLMKRISPEVRTVSVEDEATLEQAAALLRGQGSETTQG
jgi:[acyl-carrier-protein] S-malonyltransferase